MRPSTLSPPNLSADITFLHSLFPMADVFMV